MGGYRSIDNTGIYIPNNHFITPEKIDYMLESINELLDKVSRNG